MKDFSLVIELFITLFCFVTMTWALSIGMIGSVLTILLATFVVSFAVYKSTSKMEMTSVLILPIMLSAFQNLYIGYFSPALSSTSVQIMTISNFLYSLVIFAVLFVPNHKMIQKDNLFTVFIVLILYCLFSVILLKQINIISIISSFRNIISVFVFFFIGVMASKKLKIDRFQRLIIFITFVVLIIGFIDVLSKGTFWRSLNITDLWTKKGIRLQASGLPTNFYSSERINGERIRRMASSFADPVNLGAFLFAGACISWFRKDKIITVLILIGIVFTVSKGAFLGILIFFCVYAYYYTSKPMFFGISGGSLLAGVLFLVFAMRTSANSVFLHISGLTAAFRSLIRNPLGSGIGSNGVLAGLFSGYSANASITETGLGMIIGQLGIVGLLIFMYFFYSIYKSSARLQDKNEKVLCLTLVLSVIANIFFNEVALSPNSCAIYFMIVGYYVSKVWSQRSLRYNGENKKPI